MGKLIIIGQQPEKKELELGGHRCPHCGTEKPPYGFHLNAGDLGVIGVVQYFTIFCAALVDAPNPTEREPKKKTCGAILSVNITQWQPPTDPAQLAALQHAMKGGRTT
jgi:hypothetical protein